MESSEQINVQVELVYRLFNNQSNKPKDSNTIQFQPSQNLDALIVYNQANNLRQKLTANKVLTDTTRNKDFFDLLIDPEGLCMTRLLSGFNTSLITYGLSGRGKTHSWIGSDSIYNETRADFNVLTRIYGEMKKYMPNLITSLSLLEIVYNEGNKSENIIDLLELSWKEDDVMGFNFNNFSNVLVKSQHELEKILKAGLKRSNNWLERRDLEKSLGSNKIEYQANTSHLLCRLNFVNTTQKKQFSFYLVDLIGFNNDNKDSLQQMSLHQINKLIDEMSSKKEQIQAYKQKRAERLNLPNARGGSYSALVADSMKIVDFLANIILNSQPIFFVPFYKETETFKDSYPLFERCFKLSTLRYPIEREYADSSQRTNFISFQSFAKQADISFTDSYSGAKTPLQGSAQKPERTERAVPFTLIEGLSPINQSMKGNREGIYIQDNSGDPTPFREQTPLPGQQSKSKNETSSQIGRIDFLQRRADDYRTISPSKWRQEGNIEASPIRSPNKNTEMSTQKKNQLGSGAPFRSDSFGVSPKSQLFSPDSMIQQLLREENALMGGSRARPPVNKDSYFVDYNRKVKDVMGVLDNFMVSEINTLKKENLPPEYYLLRRNFDILYRIFKEGEAVSNALAKDFLELGNSINEFKQEYDEKIQEAQQRQLELQAEFTRLVEEKGLKEVFDIYERDIEKLVKEGESLKEQNLRIVNEIQEYHESESRTGVLTEFNVLNKKHNQLVKQYGKAVRHLNETEEEITVLRKKDRLFAVEKRMAETVQTKTDSLAKKLEAQEAKNNALAEKLRQLEQQNKNLKDKVRDQESDIKRISADYFATMEKAAMYKEMAKAPTDTQLKVYKEARESIRQAKAKDSPSSKRVKDLDTVLNKLKSFEY